MLLAENHPLIPVFDVTKVETSTEEYGGPKTIVKKGGSPQKCVDMLHIEDENDDDDERLARRKSRLLEPHPASVNSPRTSTGVARRRIEAAEPRGVPQAQIGEHYGNCIRLAAENKITAKNAFNLHLIDYMSEMIKREDFASFQMASSSLDAGAKIYAGRVDAVHQETYQVLTGLGRSGKVPDDLDKQQGDDDDTASDYTVPTKFDQRKKVSAHRDIIQKQLSKIRSKALAAKADVDPLFQHQAASYDEGGTAELRLNQLSTLDASCELVLDSSTPVMSHAFDQQEFTSQCSLLNVAGLSEFLAPIFTKSANKLAICASLQNFRFTEFNQPNGSSIMKWKTAVGDQPMNSTQHMMTPADDTLLSLRDSDDSFADDHMMDVVDDVNDALNLPLPPPTRSTHTSPQAQSDTTATASGDHQTTANDENTVTESELFVSSLKNMLDKQYESFGQVNDNLLGMWAGPEHWRKKSKRRKLDGLLLPGNVASDDVDGDEEMDVDKPNQSSRKPSRNRRDKGQKISYADAKKPSENLTRSGLLSRKEWPKNIISSNTNGVSPTANVFKESYRQKANRQLNILPAECTESRQSLYCLLNREIMLRPYLSLDSKHRANLNGTDMEPYNYQNGVNEFCPMIDCGDKSLHTDMVNDAADYANDSIHSNHDVDDDDDDDVIPFDFVFTQGTNAGDSALGDLELISQPHKVARIEIGYARRAKMINVRRLKTAMWGFLEQSFPHTHTGPTGEQSPLSTTSTLSAPDSGSLIGEPVPGINDRNSVSPNPVTSKQYENDLITSPSPVVQGTRNFTELIDSLASRISWQMANELSVSIALNCLLHLSNEKELYLENADGFSDIYISKGLPSSEFEQLKLHGGESVQSKKRTKLQRLRPSTLDSWLVENDTSNDLQMVQ